MNFCTNCGQQLKPEQKFCTKCGAKQNERMDEKPPIPAVQNSTDEKSPVTLEKETERQSSNSIPQDNTDEKSPVQETQNNTGAKPPFPEVNRNTDELSPPPVEQNRAAAQGPKHISFSKRSKILAGIIAAVLIILFGTYKVIEFTITPSKVEAQFVDAVKNQNINEMQSILNHNRQDLTISKDSVSDFIKYFKKHPDYFSETVNDLNTDVNQLTKNNGIYQSDNPICIAGVGKKWLLFDNYVIDLKPFYINVTSNQNPTVVSINGRPVGKVSDNKYTFGPYLLSDFKVKGIYRGKYDTVQDTLSLDPLSDNDQHLSADLNLEGNTISINSNMDNAILFVNGKSTGKTVHELSTLKPVPVNGKLKLQAILQNGAKTDKSNEVTVTENNQDVELNFGGGASITASTGAGDNLADIGNVVENHYNDISNHDYSSAYNLMSTKLRTKYNLDNWSKGLVNNISNYVSISDVTVSNDHTTAVVTFSMSSYDRQDDGSTLVQKWGGKWNLVKENNQWLLDKPDIQKLDSYTE